MRRYCATLDEGDVAANHFLVIAQTIDSPDGNLFPEAIRCESVILPSEFGQTTIIGELAIGQRRSVVWHL